MTSRVLSAFFFISLVSYVTAVDPTGLKVRITDKAQDVLRDLGLEFLQTLVNYSFADFDIPLRMRSMCTVKGLKLTHLLPDDTQTTVRFQENSSLHFEINDMNFTGELVRHINICVWRKWSLSEKNVIFSGNNVSAKIEVKLNRNPQGHLIVELPTCEVKADHIATTHSGKVGFFWDALRPIYQKAFNSQLCPAVQTYIVPKINDMLESITMLTTLYKHQNEVTASPSIVTTNLTEEDINIDYSLSNDITVTSSYLDVPFKGVIFRHGETVDLDSIQYCVDPVFNESDRMAYIGVSEFFFNSASMSLFKAGPFEIDLSKKKSNVIQNLFLCCLGLPKGDAFKVELTEAPTIRITKDGVSTTVNARAQSLAEPADQNPILPVDCQLNMKFDIKGHRLILHSKSDVKCKVRPGTVKGKFVKRIVNTALKHSIKSYLKSWFKIGVLIPLPEGVSFTDGKIDYHDGFVVIGGNLNFTPTGTQKVVKGIGR